MNLSTTTEKNSSDSFQPTKARCFEQLLSPAKSNALHQITERCRVLFQKPDVHSVIAMHSAGFHYTDDEDTVRCDECGLEVSGWTLAMKPFTVHAQRNPKCPYVRSMQSDISVPSAISLTPSDADEASVRREKIKSIQQNDQANILVEIDMMQQIRKRTFSHWPHQTSPSSAQMIEAGFFSCNVGDRVICLYCNLICQQWIPNTDNPYEVHKKLSPKCPYVMAMLKRQQAASILNINEHSTNDHLLVLNSIDPSQCNEIIDSATCHTAYVNISRQSTSKHGCWLPHCAYAKQLCAAELYKKIQESKRAQQECDKLYNKELISRFVNARLDLPISKSLVAEGFDLLIIKSCYENQLQLTHDDFVDDSDLRMACIILQKQIEYIDGKKENIIIPSVAMTRSHLELST